MGFRETDGTGWGPGTGEQGPVAARTSSLGGFRAEPTPSGVPVATMSPARSVMMFEAYDRSSNTL